MFELIDQLLAKLNLRVCESVDVPARTESRGQVPKAIADGPAFSVLNDMIPGGQVWTHQAEALKHLCDGRNVVVSTGTASGKSLIFQIYALHHLLTDPDSKVLVFYPLRALTNDQLVSWQKLAESAGLEPETVGRIYGGVSMNEREQIIGRSRIVLMTPDVCQAWLMRTLASPAVSRFVASLVLLVLDEAHVYESVFGSNTAFLLRRLLAAKRRSATGGNARQLQIVAATATIDNPADHLENLTGVSFSVVDESVNGAPRSLRRILHVEGPDLGRDGEAAMQEILAGVCALEERHRFIAFVDSRQGVERIAQAMGTESVKPYRSGYEARDRAAIERTLRSGSLHGVVSTSALELGIDIADMDIGINLGVPQSRKSFRQRLGRIGRVSPGVFLISAPVNAFTKFGEGLAEYHEGSVEPSYLYLGNRFVQFAHARCLQDETDALGRSSAELPSGVSWPDGFPDILTVARVGYPREFDPMAQIGGDSPHFNYPLRQLGETHVEIQQGQGGFETEIGDMAYHQAIREAYPGATYLHMGQTYKVNRWNQGFNKLSIRVAAARNAAPTRPILRKSVTIDLSRQGLIPGRMKRGPSGLIAEAQVQVNESVEGYSIGNTQHLYRDERAKNPNMRRKQRDFRTTGVVIQIEDDWFSDRLIRREIAEGLRDLLARDRSIAPQDIDSAHTNIALATEAGLRHPITDIVVVYDSVYGGLRLTENLFDEFSRFIERLSLGAGLSQGDGIVRAETAALLEQWAQGLSEDSNEALGGDFPQINVPEGWLQVFKPGSLVGVYSRGELHDRELVEPKYIDPLNSGTQALYYTYQDSRNQGGVSFTPADGVVPSGHEWDWVLWNPDTGEYRDMETSE